MWVTMMPSIELQHEAVAPACHTARSGLASRVLDCLRRRKADRSSVTQELDYTLAETLEGDAANPMDTTQASQQAWALHQCLSRLEYRQREVVILDWLAAPSYRVNPSAFHKKSYEISVRPCCAACAASLAS